MWSTAGINDLNKAVKVAQFLGMSDRSKRFQNASLYYWSRQYDGLEPWDTPDVKLSEQRPKVILNLFRRSVDEVVASLFGEGHTPTPRIESLATDRDELDAAELLDEGSQISEEQRTELARLNARLGQIFESSRLKSSLTKIGIKGNVGGTVAVGFHYIDGRFDIEIINVADSRPKFGYQDRALAIEYGLDFDELLELDEYWLEIDQTPDGEEVVLYHRRLWELERTVEFVPVEAKEGTELADLKWVEDNERTVPHGLGYIAAEWWQNLPVADDIDGRGLVELDDLTLIDEVNYTLSQVGRGIKYNQEPQIVFENVANLQGEEPVKRGSGNTLMIEGNPEGGAARAVLLELAGEGQRIAMEYADKLRACFWEIVSVVIHDPEHFSGALSGVALKRLLRPLIQVVNLERPQYESGLSRLLSKMMQVETGERYRVALLWPDIVETTQDEKTALSAQLRSDYLDGFITLETVIRKLAPHYGIDDVEAYLGELAAENGRGGTTGGDTSGGAFDSAVSRMERL